MKTLFPRGGMPRIRRAVAALASTAAAVALCTAATPGHPATPPAKAAVPLASTVLPSADAAAQHIMLPSGRTYWLTPGTNGMLEVGLPGTDNTAATLNAQFWSATGGWQAHAAANHYTLALAETVAGKWNVGGGWPSSGADDMQYLLDLVADVAARVPVNPAQVFAAGFSAGGAMAWTAVALHPEVFRGCAMASGWAGVAPVGTVDCWHIHGTGDTTVPIRGGAGIFNYVFPPAEREMLTALRGSRVVLYATTGGHAVPGWMASRILVFFTTDRAHP